MHVSVYHELNPDSLDTVLQEGLKRSSSGQKTDAQIEKLNTYLDTHRPDRFVEKDVSRSQVIYAFMEYEGNIIDIATGEATAIGMFRTKNGMALVRLTVDSHHCYVSDLDVYDTLKRAMELNEQDSTREQLANRYWQQVVPLGEFMRDMIPRPEVLITSDISPESIEVIRRS